MVLNLQRRSAPIADYTHDPIVGEMRPRPVNSSRGKTVSLVSMRAQGQFAAIYENVGIVDRQPRRRCRTHAYRRAYKAEDGNVLMCTALLGEIPSGQICEHCDENRGSV